MAQITVCDRCRKELTFRRTRVSLKPWKHVLGIEVHSLYPDHGWTVNNANKHFFELCDDCANRLAEFLNYGPTEGSTEENAV